MSARDYRCKLESVIPCLRVGSLAPKSPEEEHVHLILALGSKEPRCGTESHDNDQADEDGVPGING
jgi:hypothetical protein